MMKATETNGYLMDCKLCGRSSGFHRWFVTFWPWYVWHWLKCTAIVGRE